MLVLILSVLAAVAGEDDRLYTVEISRFVSSTTAMEFCEKLLEEFGTRALPVLRIESKYPYKIVRIGLFSQQDIAKKYFHKFRRRFPEAEMKTTIPGQDKLIKIFNGVMPDPVAAEVPGEPVDSEKKAASDSSPQNASVDSRPVKEPAGTETVSVEDMDSGKGYTWVLRNDDNPDYFGIKSGKNWNEITPRNAPREPVYKSEAVENLIQSLILDDNGNTLKLYSPEDENKAGTVEAPRYIAKANVRPIKTDPVMSTATENGNDVTAGSKPGTRFEAENGTLKSDYSLDTGVGKGTDPKPASIKGPEMMEGTIPPSEVKPIKEASNNTGFFAFLKSWVGLLSIFVFTALVAAILLMPNNRAFQENRTAGKQKKVEALFEKIDYRNTYGKPRLSEFIENRVMSNIREIEQIETNILTESREVKSILVTSCFAGEGKTIASLCIAYALAMGGGYRVLLVDANIENPSIHKHFNINNNVGFVDFLAADSTRSDGIIATAYRNLYIMPYGGVYSENINPYRSKSIQKRIASLKKVFDYVIFDGCSMLGSSETSHILDLIGGVIMVVECEKTKWEVVQIAQRKIGKSGGEILGAVLNKRRYYIPQILYKKL